MKQLKSLLLTTIIIASISSCGYQLRGSVNIEGLENVKIIRMLAGNIITQGSESLDACRRNAKKNSEKFFILVFKIIYYYYYYYY